MIAFLPITSSEEMTGLVIGLLALVVIETAADGSEYPFALCDLICTQWTAPFARLPTTSLGSLTPSLDGILFQALPDHAFSSAGFVATSLMRYSQ